MRERSDLPCGAGCSPSPDCPVFASIGPVLHFVTELFVAATRFDPQPPGVGRVLFLGCAIFWYCVCAVMATWAGIFTQPSLPSRFESSSKFFPGAMEPRAMAGVRLTTPT